MKLCPQCRREYYDETLLYCLDDGSRLLSGPTRDLPPTAILPPLDQMPTVIGYRSEPSANTIAVLPFLNLSRGEDAEYFSDGLAEELLNVLSKVQGLRVAARTSAFSFKGKQQTVS